MDVSAKKPAAAKVPKAPTKAYAAPYGHSLVLNEDTNKTNDSQQVKKPSKLPISIKPTAHSWREMLKSRGDRQTAGKSQPANSKTSDRIERKENKLSIELTKHKNTLFYNNHPQKAKEEPCICHSNFTNKIVRTNNCQRVQIDNIGPDFSGRHQKEPLHSLASAKPIPDLGTIFKRLNNGVLSSWLVGSVDEYQTAIRPNSSVSFPEHCLGVRSSEGGAKSVTVDERTTLDRVEEVDSEICDSDAQIEEQAKAMNVIGEVATSPDEEVAIWLSNGTFNCNDNESGYSSMSPVRVKKEKSPIPSNISGNTITKGFCPSIVREQISFNASSGEPKASERQICESALTVLIEKSTARCNISKAKSGDGPRFEETKHTTNQEIATETSFTGVEGISKYYQFPSKFGNLGDCCCHFPPSYVDCPSEILQKTTNLETAVMTSSMHQSASYPTTEGELRDNMSCFTMMDPTAGDERSFIDDESECHCMTTNSSYSHSGPNSVNHVSEPNITDAWSQDDGNFIYGTVQESSEKSYVRRCADNSTYTRLGIKVMPCTQIDHLRSNNLKKTCHNLVNFCRYKGGYSRGVQPQITKLAGTCRRKWNNAIQKTLHRWMVFRKKRFKFGCHRLSVSAMSFIQRTMLWEDADVQTQMLYFRDTGTVMMRDQKSMAIATSLRLHSWLTSYNKLHTDSQMKKLHNNIKKIQLEYISRGPSMFPLPNSRKQSLQLCTTVQHMKTALEACGMPLREFHSSPARQSPSFQSCAKQTEDIIHKNASTGMDYFNRDKKSITGNEEIILPVQFKFLRKSNRSSETDALQYTSAPGCLGFHVHPLKTSCWMDEQTCECFKTRNILDTGYFTVHSFVENPTSSGKLHSSYDSKTGLYKPTMSFDSKNCETMTSVHIATKPNFTSSIKSFLKSMKKSNTSVPKGSETYTCDKIEPKGLESNVTCGCDKLAPKGPENTVTCECDKFAPKGPESNVTDECDKLAPKGSEKIVSCECDKLAPKGFETTSTCDKIAPQQPGNNATSVTCECDEHALRRPESNVVCDKFTPISETTAFRVAATSDKNLAPKRSETTATSDTFAPKRSETTAMSGSLLPKVSQTTSTCCMLVQRGSETTSTSDKLAPKGSNITFTIDKLQSSSFTPPTQTAVLQEQICNWTSIFKKGVQTKERAVVTEPRNQKLSLTDIKLFTISSSVLTKRDTMSTNTSVLSLDASTYTDQPAIGIALLPIQKSAVASTGELTLCHSVGLATIEDLPEEVTVLALRDVEVGSAFINIASSSPAQKEIAVQYSEPNLTQKPRTPIVKVKSTSVNTDIMNRCFIAIQDTAGISIESYVKEDRSFGSQCMSSRNEHPINARSNNSPSNSGYKDILEYRITSTNTDNKQVFTKLLQVPTNIILTKCLVSKATSDTIINIETTTSTENVSALRNQNITTKSQATSDSLFIKEVASQTTSVTRFNFDTFDQNNYTCYSRTNSTLATSATATNSKKVYQTKSDNVDAKWNRECVLPLDNEANKDDQIVIPDHFQKFNPQPSIDISKVVTATVSSRPSPVFNMDSVHITPPQSKILGESILKEGFPECQIPPSTESLFDLLPNNVSIAFPLPWRTPNESQTAKTPDKIEKNISKEFQIQAKPDSCDAGTDSIPMCNSDVRDTKSASAITSRVVLPPCNCRNRCSKTDECVFVYDNPKCLTHNHSLTDVSLQIYPSRHDVEVETSKEHAVDEGAGSNASIPCYSRNSSLPTARREDLVTQRLSAQPVPEQRNFAELRHLGVGDPSIDVLRKALELSPKVYKALYETSKLLACTKCANVAVGTDDMLTSNLSTQILYPERMSAGILTTQFFKNERDPNTPESSSSMTPATQTTPPIKHRYRDTFTQPSRRIATDGITQYSYANYSSKALDACQPDGIDIGCGSRKEFSDNEIQPWWYNHVLNQHIGRVKDCLRRQLIHYNDRETRFYDMDLSGDTMSSGQPATGSSFLKSSSSCHVTSALSSLDIAGKDKKDLNTVYYTLSAIEGRIRRLRSNLPE